MGQSIKLDLTTFTPEMFYKIAAIRFDTAKEEITLTELRRPRAAVPPANDIVMIDGIARPSRAAHFGLALDSAEEEWNPEVIIRNRAGLQAEFGRYRLLSATPVVGLP